jgi:UDP-N-acetyl-D-mannosaminuronic acid dehydrogenase
MSMVELISKIENTTARLAVIGLGYVGLPVAAMFAEAGFDVLGVELRAERVKIINAGRNPIEGDEPGLADLLQRNVSANKLRASSNYDDLKDRDIILIDVETPVNERHFPEYDALRSVLNALGPALNEGALVIVESTIAPGTMSGLVCPLLEHSSCKRVNSGFYLGNCPERVMPGKLLANLQKMSRVVGGGSPDTTKAMILLYRYIVQADLDATDWVTAELVKTVENSYRDVQIAFANEIALICETAGADVWRVRELVNKSPNRQMHLPGAGVGGHCIPKDPWLLASTMKDSDQPLRLIPVARVVNDSMPHHMFELIQKGLKKNGQPLDHARILVLGYTYLENSDDTRNAPSAVLVAELEKAGMDVKIHDPYLKDFQGDIAEMARDCDIVVLMTAHDEYKKINLEKLKSAMRSAILVDGRNLFDKETARSTGFLYMRIGDGAEN